MIYSKTCEYAIRALAHLARQGKNVYMGASEISEAINVPGPYISKIFRNLTHKKVLKSRRGAAGGFALCCNPEHLSLMQIVEAIDDMSPFHECAMGLDRCEDQNPCPLHDIWKKAKQEIVETFKSTKLTELGKSTKKFEYAKLKRLKLRVA